jgi:hypothetical protein
MVKEIIKKIKQMLTDKLRKIVYKVEDVLNHKGNYDLNMI